MNPFSLEIFRHLLSGIAEEMGAALMRTALSPNIKERRDFSCALFDAQGQLLSQASHIPVHLGSMPALMQWVLEHCSLDPGDVWMANDPYHGGTHLPDVTVISPFFWQGRLFGLAANRAHHADIGGSSPGSMPLSVDIYQEGLILPPVPLVKKGKRQQPVWDILLANVRTPAEREGDFEAQLAANRIAHRRWHETITRYGSAWLLEHQKAIMAYSEQLTRAALADLPAGQWTFTDYLEEPGTGRPIPIKVKVTLQDGTATCDFTGTAPLQANCLNAPLSVTQAAVYYVFRCLTGDHIPPNQGCFNPIGVVVPKGCLLHAQPPYGVAGGNVETSQRVVDVVLGALAMGLPDRIPAASAGTMNNLSFGGYDERQQPFTYYETIGGGCGASFDSAGRSAVQTHMTNTQNTPIEALEMAYPVRMRRYAIRSGSGGQGQYSGGKGLVRELEFLTPTRVIILSDRRHMGPWGLQGGRAGAPGRNLHNAVEVDGKVAMDIAAGDVVTIETPGGGGYGVAEG